MEVTSLQKLGAGVPETRRLGERAGDIAGVVLPFSLHCAEADGERDIFERVVGDLAGDGEGLGDPFGTRLGDHLPAGPCGGPSAPVEEANDPRRSRGSSVGKSPPLADLEKEVLSICPAVVTSCSLWESVRGMRSGDALDCFMRQAEFHCTL